MHPNLLTELSRHARAADEEPRWPERSWHILGQLGAFRWAIPALYGGDGLGGGDLLQRYEALAAGCLTSCFILRNIRMVTMEDTVTGRATLLRFRTLHFQAPILLSEKCLME